MKNHEVVAYTGRGDAKKEVGRKSIKLAESIKDAISICGNEERVVVLINQQLTTNTRNQLAKPAGGSVADKTKFASAQKLVESKVDWAIVEAATGFTKESYAERLKAQG